MIAQLVRGKLAAVLLGPSGVGVFNQLSVLWNLFNVAGGLGSFLGVVQHGTEALAADDRAALRRLSSTFLVLLGVASCTIALIGVLLSRQLSAWALHDEGQHANYLAALLLCVPLAVTAQTYHALLSAGRAVRALVTTQIITDLGAMLVFAGLIVPLGLTGAIAGFIATYAMMVAVKACAVRKLLGRDLCVPKLREFSWATVRSNVGFGASGLLTVVLTNLAILLVSRIIIRSLGLGANGIFSNAWRIGSVLLGSIATTSTAYLIPTLGRSESASEMRLQLNKALRFYLYVLPLPMAAVIAGGELIVWMILSRGFLPAAQLFLLFMPAELIRVFGETVAATLIVNRRMVWYTSITALQFGIFLAGSMILVPQMGLTGAALSYLIGYLCGTVLTVVLAWRLFGICVERRVLELVLKAAVLLVGTALISHFIPFGLMRLLASGLLFVGWLAVMMIDAECRETASRLLLRVRRG